MTYIDKFRQLHPEFNGTEDEQLVRELLCPDLELRVEGLRCPNIGCLECWQMEMEGKK